MRTDNTIGMAEISYQPSVLMNNTNKLLDNSEKKALYTLGYVLYSQGKYESAIPFFTILSLHNPDEERYYAALGACQKMVRAYEKSINNYAMALLLEPNHFEHILHIAECQIAGLYTEGAIDTLTQLLALDLTGRADASEIKQKAQALLTLLKQDTPKH